ncbi:MAG: phenylalanine 4-monooxygenase, partial [Alphaproteobacteria bacterium]
LARLYWYTVEFGLIRRPEGLRIYGAGIASSKGESVFALDDPSPNRIKFDLMRVMRTDYRIDDYQQTYFVIDSFDELFDATVERDFGPIYDELPNLSEFQPQDVLETDEVITRGTQEYARSKRAKEREPA